MNKDIKIFSNLEIINDLIDSIENKKSFSLIRLGDGGLKFIYSYFYNDLDQIIAISKKEGIPINKIGDTIKLWSASVNVSNFIDSPYVYSTKDFWNRIKKNKPISLETKQKLDNWELLYKLAGFKNKNYCNPEINFLMCLDLFEEKSLPNILKEKKLCFITSRTDLKEKIKNYDFDVFNICGQEDNQYLNSFNKTLDFIYNESEKYDLFLISAGELGRIYTGLIKYKNGRAFDIGSLIDYWCEGLIPTRLLRFMNFNKENKLELKLTEEGIKFKNNICEGL